MHTNFSPYWHYLGELNGQCTTQSSQWYLLLGLPKRHPRLKMPFIIFFFLQSQITVWALKRMHAFKVLSNCMQSLGCFYHIPPWTSFVKLGNKYAKESKGLAHGEMLICSKLGQNLSEKEVETFVRIQRVTWDHFLASDS